MFCIDKFLKNSRIDMAEIFFRRSKFTITVILIVYFR